MARFGRIIAIIYLNSPAFALIDGGDAKGARVTLQGSIFLPASRASDVRRILLEALVARAEPQKFVEYFHEDACIRLIGQHRDYRFAGDFRGRTQILDLCRRILSLVVDGDKVALRRSCLARHHASGGEQRLTMAALMKFRDLRIAEGVEYADTTWLKRMLGED